MALFLGVDIMNEKEKVILVGVNLNNDKDFAYSMEELANLSIANDLEIVGNLVQNAASISTIFYIGKGKVEELKELVENLEANTVIFNDELSPSQTRNLEKTLGCGVIDRTILILEIFALRAKTKEAKLQVEMARLNYLLPYLIGSNSHLGRQGGGSGLNNKGSGETKLELDRRKIMEKISFLRKELGAIVKERSVQRNRRKNNNVPVISLVGYTNAGKSTIMNAMVSLFNDKEEKKVFEKNMLFATLETSVRNITLPDKKSFLLTDTVGFINKLPHQLVKAFRSTLEEITEADLIIHVVDYGNDNYLQQMAVTNNTLKEIGADNIPVIYAYNKCDLINMEIPKIEEDSVYLSAKLGIGIHALIEEITKFISKDYIRCNMLIPYDEGNLIVYFKQYANVFTTQYLENGTLIKMECNKNDVEKYKGYII